MFRRYLCWSLFLWVLHLHLPKQLYVESIQSHHFPVPNGAFIPHSFHVGKRTIRHHEENGTTVSIINNYPHEHFFIRNVPGDGSCLFHSLAVCLRQKVLQCYQKDFDGRTRELSKWLRVKVELLQTEFSLHFTSASSFSPANLIHLGV